MPTHVDDNPSALLFDPPRPTPRAAGFRSWFVNNAVEALASAGDIDRFDYPTLVPATYGAGEALLITDQNNYRVALGSGQSTFRTALTGITWYKQTNTSGTLFATTPASLTFALVTHEGSPSMSPSDIAPGTWYHAHAS